MSKQNKKLLAEIQNGLKQVDEGVAQLEMLESKVENASTISIKEKYRQDMKREIKRLQRLRDIFRQNVSNPAITEQHKLVEARKRIETEMEKFRDHEKEYKSKRPTKAAMQNETEIKGKFNFGSDSDFNEEYDEDEIDLGSEEDVEEDASAPDIVRDKLWLQNFIQDTLRMVLGKYDAELEKIQNKKTKGGLKKNREKINALKGKKSNIQQIKERAEELQITMDYIEPGKIRYLRQHAKQLLQNYEDEAVRLSVLSELESLIETSEQNRKAQQSSSGANPSQYAFQDGQLSSKIKVDELDLKNRDDLVLMSRPLTQLRTGNICDAKDYLGNWHLSIVIDDGSSSQSKHGRDQRTIHFLPYTKANRDEVFSVEMQERLAPAFQQQESSLDDPSTKIATLYAYLESHLKKIGQASPPPPISNGAADLSQSQEESKVSHQKQQALGKQGGRHGGEPSQVDTRNQYQGGQPGASLQLQKGKQSKLQSQQAETESSLEEEHKQKLEQRAPVRGSNDPQGIQADSIAMEEQKNILHSGSSNPHALSFQGAPLGGDQASAGKASQQHMAPLFNNNFRSLGQPESMNSMGIPALGQDIGFQDQSKSQISSESLGQLQGMIQVPQQIKDTSQTERKHNLEMLETSFRNILIRQDQDVEDPKYPVSVWEENDYPRVPLYNKQENFSRFDLETLFFAFYYQQGTYQQYLAAVELKKQNWKFVKKFETWFKKVENEAAPNASASQAARAGSSSQPGAPQGSNQSSLDKGSREASAPQQAQKDVGKYKFFDFENGWQQLVRDDFELDLSQVENELPIPTSLGATAQGVGIGNLRASGGQGAAALQGQSNSGAPSRATHAQ